MRKILITSMVAILLLAFTVPVFAESENSASASVSIMSNYVWRGITLSNSVAIQPSVDFVKGNFGVNFWANYDTDPNEAAYPNDNAVVNETDLTLNYSVPIEAISLDVGYIYYALGGAADTQEIYVSAGMPAGPVELSLAAYYDYDLGTGWFAQAGVDFSKEINEKLSFSLGASASYVADNNVVGLDANGEEYTGLHNGQITAGLSYDAGNGISIEPSLAYSTPLSDDAEDAIKAYSVDGEDSIAYGGVSVSVGF